LNTPNATGFDSTYLTRGPKNTLWVTDLGAIVRITVAAAHH
jgi:hypothetical protein